MFSNVNSLISFTVTDEYSRCALCVIKIAIRDRMKFTWKYPDRMHRDNFGWHSGIVPRSREKVNNGVLISTWLICVGHDRLTDVTGVIPFGFWHRTVLLCCHLLMPLCQTPGLFFCPFYGRNSAIFPMANHIFFFPNFCPKIPNSKDQKICCQTKVFRGVKARENALLMGMQVK